MGIHGTALILAMCVQAACIHAADWPQFRGPNRDDKSPETGLLKKWPETGPRLLRTISGVGEGFSSPSIAGGRLYITGKGAVIHADGMLYCVGHSARVALLAANPAAYTLISMFQLPKAEGPCWTHAVISNAKLYLRWSDNFYVYDIKE